MKRAFYIKLLDNLKDAHVIKVVTGVRRCGKSTLLEQYQEELRSHGVPDSRIQVFNLEDKKNASYTDNANLLHDTILDRLDDNGMNYVFIDEVQLIPEFEKTLDSLFLHKNIDLYVTGSNADITSSEIGTLLSGRYVEIRMQPLTFSEFIQFFPDSDRSSKFSLFLQYGGFPEVANFLSAGSTEAITPYLRSIYDTVLEKDIKKRKNIRSMDDFRACVEFAFNNIGNITSPNNIAGVLSAGSRKVDNETITGYLDALADCYIIYPTQRFDIRGKELLKTLKKYYAVDLGLVDSVLGLPSNADSGRRLENLVFLELNKRYNGRVWVGKNYEKEIDFVAKRADGQLDYYQVAETAIEEKTFKREIASLENTGDSYQKTLLTLDLLETNDGGIRKKNIINWLCEE